MNKYKKAKFFRTIQLFVLLLISLLPNFVIGQQLTSSKEQAEKYFSEMNFSKAAILFERLNNKKENFTYERYLAQCYRHLQRFQEAEKQYSKIIRNKAAKAEDHFWYARMLQSNEKFSEAMSEFKIARIGSLIKPSLLDSIEKSCLKADSLINHPTNFKVKNLGKINSSYSEFGAVRYQNGIVFASDRPNSKKDSTELAQPLTAGKLYAGTGTPFIKMYYADIKVGNHELKDSQDETLFKNKTFDIQPLDSHLNEVFHNGPAVFNNSETRIYFTRTREVKRPEHFEKKNSSWADFLENTSIDFINQLELWYSDKTPQGWSNPKPFTYNSSTQYSVGHPALSPDGKTLYFASDMPGGFGGLDLYYSTITSDSIFSKPVNMGNVINTAGDEEFPSISKRGILYFASNGRAGIGGLDLYKSKHTLQWSIPENLGSPLNTSNDDFAFLSTALNDSKGYLSSNRKGTKGRDDLFEFVNDIKRILSIEVKDEHNIPVKGAQMIIVDGKHPEGHTQLTDNDGKTKIETRLAELSHLKASKEGFKMFEKDFEADTVREENDSVGIVITLIKISENQNEVLKEDSLKSGKQAKGYFVRNIYYAYDKYDIKDKSRHELERLCALLKKYPGVSVEIGSHTDSRGTDSYNIKLSRKRADEVTHFLVANGIEPGRLIAKGYGESRIINKCKNNIPCSKEEHQQNRRTEFKIVK